VTALLALLGPKVLGVIGALAAGALAVLGAWAAGRHSGTAAAHTADLTRELGDRRTADAISAATALEPDPKAALDKEFGR
jgi:hypothetical protein